MTGILGRPYRRGVKVANFPSFQASRALLHCFACSGCSKLLCPLGIGSSTATAKDGCAHT